MLRELNEIMSRENNENNRFENNITNLTQLKYLLHQNNIFYILINSKIVLYISPLLIFFLSLFIYELIKLTNLIKKGELEFNQKIFENKKLSPLYTYLYIILIILFYIFFQITHYFLYTIKDNDYSLNSISFTFEDIIYFSPYYKNVLVYIMNKNFFSTNFDIFIITTTDTLLCFLFVYSKLSAYFFKYKIEHTYNIVKNFKLKLFGYYIFFGLINLNILLFLLILIPFKENFVIFVTLISKSLYLFFHQIQLLISNIFLYEGNNTNENKIFLELKIKLLFDLILNSLLCYEIFYGLYLFVKKDIIDYFFFIFVNIITINNLIYILLKICYLYKFIKKKDFDMPLENLENKEIQCIICTEILNYGRKLPCSHYFHLVCLMEWITQGKKQCPICRKQIDVEGLDMFHKKMSQIYYEIREFIIRKILNYFNILELNIRIERNHPENVNMMNMILFLFFLISIFLSFYKI
jgi:hypothetical protein